jgi:hypothetical protein
LQQVREFAEAKVPIPDHLLGLDEAEIKELRKVFRSAEEAGGRINALAIDVLSKISRSEDDVSKRLHNVFSRATAPTLDELKRARQRRECGNPPGKSSDPLGDQISWEQLLTHCTQNGCKRIWIITDDTDYLAKYQKKRLLNPLLNRDLVSACRGQPEVRCFDDLLDGLTEFAKVVGVDEKNLPTTQEAKQIKEEISTWVANTSSFDDAAVTVVRDRTRLRNAAVQEFSGADSWLSEGHKSQD